MGVGAPDPCVNVGHFLDRERPPSEVAVCAVLTPFGPVVGMCTPRNFALHVSGPFEFLPSDLVLADMFFHIFEGKGRFSPSPRGAWGELGGA